MNNGHSAGLFTFSGVDSTDQVVITIATAGDSVDFTIANAVGVSLMGFLPAVVTAPSASYAAYSDGPASFN